MVQIESQKDNKRVDLLTRYNDLLDTRPVATKAITAAIIQAIGAALGSAFSVGSDEKGRRKRGRVDWLAVLAFALHGGVVNGPVGHYWFDWLSKNGPESPCKSMLVDQMMVQPPLILLMFVFLDSTKSAIQEIRPSLIRNLSTVGPTIINSWKFWPFAVLCTFRYLKKKHYTVALNLCSLAWTVYLSKGKNKQSS